MDVQPSGDGAGVIQDDYHLCYHHGNEVFHEYEAFCTPGPVEGRFLIIQLPNTEYLTFCEVEVFGMFCISFII